MEFRITSMSVIYFNLLLGLYSQKLIIFIHTEFYPNMMENAEVGQNSIYTVT